MLGHKAAKVVRIWDLDTGAVQVLGPVPGAGEGNAGGFQGLSFLDRDRLLAGTTAGLVLFDLRDGRLQVVAPKVTALVDVSRARNLGLGLQEVSESPGHYQLVRFSLDGQGSTVLTSHGHVVAAALDPTGNLVASGSVDGTVRVGPVTGGEPHYFLGHEGPAWTVRVLSRRPLAGLGRVRQEDPPVAASGPLGAALPDPPAGRAARQAARPHQPARGPRPSSATGYKIEAGPFPGWASAPRVVRGHVP